MMMTYVYIHIDIWLLRIFIYLEVDLKDLTSLRRIDFIRNQNGPHSFVEF